MEEAASETTIRGTESDQRRTKGCNHCGQPQTGRQRKPGHGSEIWGAYQIWVQTNLIRQPPPLLLPAALLVPELFTGLYGGSSTSINVRLFNNNFTLGINKEYHYYYQWFRYLNEFKPEILLKYEISSEVPQFFSTVMQYWGGQAPDFLHSFSNVVIPGFMCWCLLENCTTYIEYKNNWGM